MYRYVSYSSKALISWTFQFRKLIELTASRRDSTAVRLVTVWKIDLEYIIFFCIYDFGRVLFDYVKNMYLICCIIYYILNIRPTNFGSYIIWNNNENYIIFNILYICR